MLSFSLGLKVTKICADAQQKIFIVLNPHSLLRLVVLFPAGKATAVVRMCVSLQQFTQDQHRDMPNQSINRNLDRYSSK